MHISPRRLNYITDIAQECLYKFGTRNPFLILKYLQIECSFVNTQYTNAFLTKDTNGNSTVYISNSLGKYYQKILCAHELGHILLHPKHALHLFGESKDDQLEYEANLFALSLMPQIQPRDKHYLEYAPHELQKYLEEKIHMHG
ncbi:MAG: ImmA/IrrE family metallo-endopeptidase [Firmicutes bacterium]|nr:ImmA/IrrE family metallo-endopeptidase [Bacillota bacterium]